MALTHNEAIERKKTMIDEFKKKMEQAKIAIVTDYRGETKGMTVKMMSDLRRKLRETKSEYRVFKNTISRKASNDVEAGTLSDYFKQPTAVVFGYEDPAATSKALVDFINEQKENQLPKIRAAFMDGKLFFEDSVTVLATLPPKPVLLSNLLRVLNAPAQNLVNVLTGVPRALVTVLSEIKKQKEEQGA